MLPSKYGYGLYQLLQPWIRKSIEGDESLKAARGIFFALLIFIPIWILILKFALWLFR